MMIGIHPVPLAIGCYRIYFAGIEQIIVIKFRSSFYRDPGSFKSMEVKYLKRWYIDRQSDNQLSPIPMGEIAVGVCTGRWTTLFCVNPVNASSDKRLNTDIHPIAYGLNEVMKMQPVSYRWKKGEEP